MRAILELHSLICKDKSIMVCATPLQQYRSNTRLANISVLYVNTK